MLASLDAANRDLAEDFRGELAACSAGVERLKDALTAHGYTLVGDEPMKVTVATKAYGYRGTDLELRMMLAGIDRDKLVQAPSPTAAADAVVLEGIDRVCVAYDNYNGDICDECVSRLVERMGKE
jgi:hypothetical protein